MAHIDLSDDQLKALITSAVLETLTPERREDILSKAVTSLLEDEPQTSYGYGKPKKSRMQRAFELAVQDVAQDTARDMLTQEPMAGQIRALVSEAMARVFDGERENVVTSLSNTFAEAISKGMAR